MPIATLSLTIFTERNFVADFVQVSVILDEKKPFCVFESSLLGLSGNIRCLS